MIPNLDGLGIIKSIVWKDGKAQLRFALAGLEDREIDIICGKINISEDGSQVTAGDFSSNMPFMENILNRFASGSFTIKDKNTQAAILAAKTLLDIK